MFRIILYHLLPCIFGCVTFHAHSQQKDTTWKLLMKSREVMYGNVQLAEKYIDSAVALSIAAKDSNAIAKNILAKADLMLYIKKDFPSALDLSYKALNTTPAFNTGMRGQIYTRIGEILYKQGFTASAKQNIYTAFSLMKLPQDSFGLHNAFNIYGTFFLGSAQPDSAIYFFKKALPLLPSGKPPLERTFLLHNIGRAYEMQKKYSEALAFHEKALNIRLALKDNNHIGMSYLLMASVHKSMGALQQSLNLYNKAMPYALHSGNLYETQLLYGGLSDVSKQLGDFRSAFSWLQKYHEVKDSLYRTERIKAVKELEEKFQNEKKQKEITALQYSNQLAKANNESMQKEQQRSRIAIAALVALIILMGCIIFLLRSKSRQQRRINAANQLIAEQKLTEAERTATISSYNKFITWQEEERNRMAKDLHDTLGGLLSGVKLSLSRAMHVNEPIKKQQVIERTFTMLDKAHDEIRKIAHDVMPENLRRYGLIAAIEDHVNHVKIDTGVDFELEYNDDLKKLDSNTSVNIYRIIHELFNNTLKYAGATSVLLQLTRSNGSLFLLYEDNGKGFILSEALQNGGMGLRSIETRTDYLKGKLSIDPQPGSGTTVLIEIPVSQ